MSIGTRSRDGIAPRSPRAVHEARKTCCARNCASLDSALRFAEAEEIAHFHVPVHDAIRLEGTLIEVLREGKLFRVELVNGHRLLGHVSQRRQQQAAGLKAGDKVNLEMSPFDFSKGRIVLEEKQK